MNNIYEGKSVISQQISYLRDSIPTIHVDRLYATSALAKACAEFWADNVSQIKFTLIDPNGEPVDPGKDELAGLLASPNFKLAMRKTELTLRFYGYSLLYKQRNRFGYVKSLRWINPALFGRNVNPNTGLLESFQLYTGAPMNGRTSIYPHEAVYFNEFSFEDEYDGVSSAEVVALQIATEPEIAMTNLAFFRNMAIPAAIVQPAQDAAAGANRKEVPALTRFLGDRFRGAINAAKTLVTPSRWEWVQLQAPIKDLDLAAQYNQLREAVAVAFNISVGFISIGQSQHNELDGQIVVWLDRRFRPRAMRYADVLTEDLCVDEHEGFHIEADISELVRSDEKLNLEIVSGKVSGSLMTVDQGQEALGQVPDEAMRGMYIIGGVPIPREDVRQYYKLLLNRGGGADPNAPDDGGGGLNTGEGMSPNTRLDSAGERADKVVEGLVPAAKPPIPRAMSVLPEFYEVDDSYFVSDSAFKELRAAVAKSLDGKVFEEPKSISPYTVEYIKTLASGDIEIQTDELLALAKKHYVRVSSAKSLYTVENGFVSDMNNLMYDGVVEQIGEAQFSTTFRDILNSSATNAMIAGLQDGGVNTTVLEEQDADWIASYTADNGSYVDGLSAQVAKGELSLAQARGRVPLWFRKFVMTAYYEGMASASKNASVRWVRGMTEKGCDTCKMLDGQVRRIKTLKERNLMPKSDHLDCKGFNCDCKIVPSDEPVTRGRLLAHSRIS